MPFWGPQLRIVVFWGLRWGPLIYGEKEVLEAYISTSPLVFFI